MSKPLHLDPDRFFQADGVTGNIARRLFAEIENLPIISPHGHTDPSWFANDTPFEDATSLFLWPDHYVHRMLYSQGIKLTQLGMAPKGGTAEPDRRKAWKIFAEHYYLFRGTPSRTWLDHAFSTVFGIDVRLDGETADHYYDVIKEKLATPAFKPRALFKRFNIELLATTEGATDPLVHHQKIKKEWDGRVITTFRPDGVVNPDIDGFAKNMADLAEITHEDVATWKGYLAALRNRRQYFREMGGATATDHGHPTPITADLPEVECQRMLDRALKGALTPTEAEMFRGQMLTEMALMSIEDGMTMQIHPGSFRNHNAELFAGYGPDRGADIPMRASYVDNLKPLLDKVGNRSDLTILLFTLDESNYARELAPLAGHYPCLTLGPAWWFHDSPEGMIRFRRNCTETAGFYNTAGFNDDTRAFLSIPARHNVARRMDCVYLAELVATKRLPEEEAVEVAKALAYDLPKKAYHL
ncbi:glucuronate isomerase [Rhizomicrobium palustre]|uniref:Uronate isomerase n=1 Tax=Rhizomicrobium palustre TaxID=189966 RepID=A0A846MY12_9PROT|nr:glucuronate isomerase [Rhizomicrobium palustre]NIK88488.1 glucuronate isomerase [Rhizomicrobium palustre]